VNGAIHTAAAQQAVVGSIYNGIDLQTGNILLDNGNNILHSNLAAINQ
jgi:hypothetical protein